MAASIWVLIIGILLMIFGNDGEAIAGVIVLFAGTVAVAAQAGLLDSFI